ncbi:MAG: dockerin type I domain-containing protein, partial [Methanospirillum sp.]
PSHRYDQIGDYTVTLRVIGVNSLCDLASHDVTTTSPPVPEFTFAGQWGRSAPGSGFITPVDVAVDRGGNLYVLDEYSDWVRKYSPNGTLLARWGGSGSGPGQLNGPSGIAVDNATGSIYVADQGNQRVQKFTSTGAPAPEWSWDPDRRGHTENFVNVAVDGAGNVYAVEDDPNPYGYYIDDEVWEFNPTGTCVQSFPVGRNNGYESERETFHHSRGLAVDAAGTIHVIDDLKSQVRSFAPNGTFLREWEIGRSPNDIAVDRAGNVYLSTGSSTGGAPDLRKFSATGSLLAQWGTEGTANGQLGTPMGLCLDSAGNLYVADDHSTFLRDWGSSRVQKFSPTGTYLAKWSCSGFGDGQFDSPRLAVDPAGTVYVLDPTNDRVQKFSSSGTFLAKWGNTGSGDGQFNDPYGIAVDRAGNVYVADTGNNRVQKFDSSGKFLKKWGTKGSGDGQFSGPGSIAVDRTGYVYVLDSRVQKFDSSGALVLKWGEGQFGILSPVDMTTDPEGSVYVTKDADTGSGQVVKYAPNGTQVAALPFGNWPHHPWVYGIAVDAAGIQYWTSHTPDAYLGVISALSVVSKEGVLLATLGGSGSGRGEGWFDDPRDIAIDDAGNLYVADAGNHRIQKFVRAGPAPVALPSASDAPTDTDGDGKYDDVNGNGRRDFNDVVLYFNQMSWIAANEPVTAFDCNGNGRIDFADIAWLFNHL